MSTRPIAKERNRPSKNRSTLFESGPRLYFLAFLTFTLALWVIAYGLPFGLEGLYGRAGFVPFALIFGGSYFSFFTASKYILKPTDEEKYDDTSTFAIFSACRRKERRGLFSLVFAFFQTIAFVLYLVHKDTGWFVLT